MAIVKKEENAAPAAKTIKVLKVTDTGNGSYRLNLDINGVEIYACKYIVGKNGAFISFPSYKGKDDKWYNTCYNKLTEADITEIENQISNLL